MREFHLSAKARRHFQIDEMLFGFDGRVIFVDFHAARLFSGKLQEEAEGFFAPETRIKAGEINAIGLIDEIFHFIIKLYQMRVYPYAIEKLDKTLLDQFGATKIDQLFASFLEFFPPQEIFHQTTTSQAYLNSSQPDGTPNRAVIIEELMLLWLENNNPAYQPYRPLFSDADLRKTIYKEIFPVIEEYFSSLPGMGPQNQNLVDLLRSPSKAEPHSITGQLEYIKKFWGEILGDYLHRLLSSLDLLKEDEKIGLPGPGPVEIPVYDAFEEYSLLGENYTQDRDWMPNLVLIAKNTYVWLYQLSKKYQRPIQKLSDIPEEEIATLAKQGITGLWLIGLWERSAASARIKQLCGNPEAISSAYALNDYQIADDLGGEEAYQALNNLAARYGIRLASDMVPNHMAIDSRWVYEHPDWFISLPYSPFPAYSFNGPDLSTSPYVSLHIDDHYFNRTDAAVVFKRTDKHTGNTQFIYHGNDGTSFPWNDTAQLNYLKPEVREAVINTIIQVAKKFPIIRFDAAMTLTKKHYQRLWFPQPGTGGDIPSRADYGMTTEQFNLAMPREFWREVVDRMAVETPDTLLLAEAFWLMESYFVRTLGMHRVYNSAFMNLLRDEENAKYRSLIKNTLEFDPEILKRFVNFMNNPDERTAVDQFGKSDKYFGICTLMATLPGLPMLGHGQIEGYTEKYGMEYQKAYLDEAVDSDLVKRHHREIFPLLHKRYLFANVQNFLLYDFYIPSGYVDENVFAFSNQSGTEKALVFYNNSYERRSGWIRTSAQYLDKATGSLSGKTLVEGLLIQNEPEMYTVCKDQISGLEFLFSNSDLHHKGIYFELNGYEHHVFIHFRQMHDPHSVLKKLYQHLNGGGISSIQNAVFEMEYEQILRPIEQILNPGWFEFLYSSQSDTVNGENIAKVIHEIHDKFLPLLQAVTERYDLQLQVNQVIQTITRQIKTISTFARIGTSLPQSLSGIVNHVLKDIFPYFKIENKKDFACLLCWIFLKPFVLLRSSDGKQADPLWFFNEWKLDDRLTILFSSLSGDTDNRREIETIRLLLIMSGWLEDGKTDNLQEKLQKEILLPQIQQYIGANRYQNIDWLNREKLEEYLCWLLVSRTIDELSNPRQSVSASIENILRGYQFLTTTRSLAAEAGYQLEIFLGLLGKNISNKYSST